MALRFNNVRLIWRVNLNLLMATICGLAAWGIGSLATIEWWGLYGLVLILGLAAMSALIEAVRLIRTIHARESILEAYRRDGDGRKGGRLSQPEELGDML